MNDQLADRAALVGIDPLAGDHYADAGAIERPDICHQLGDCAG
jgi:hypothetical protein